MKRTKHILAIGGDEELRTKIAAWLGGDFVVKQISGGQEGIDALRANPCCVVQCGSMADMERYEFLAAALCNDLMSSAPIVMIVSAGEDEDGYMRAGAQDTIGAEWMCQESLRSIVGNTIQRSASQGTNLRVQSELAAEGNFLKQVLDSLFAFVGVMLPDGTLIEVNGAPLEVAALKREEVIGRKFWETYWWDYSVEVVEDLRKAIGYAAQGEIVRYDVPVRVAGGEVLWIDFQIAPLVGENGEITHLIPSGMDISERLRDQEGLKESERKLRAIYDGTQEYMGLIDREGFMLEANLAALSFSEMEASDIEGVPFWECGWFKYTPGMSAKVERAVHQAISGNMVREEVRVRNHLGDWKIFDLWLSPVKGLTGEVELIVPVGRDITELKREALARRQSEIRAAATFENIAIGIAHVGLDGTWLRFNQKICEITGYTQENLKLKTFVDITHPDDLDKDVAQLTQLTNGEISTYSMEKRYIRWDESIVWVNITVSMLRDGNGVPEYYIASVEDISARCSMTGELRKQKRFVERITSVMPGVLYVYSLRERRNIWVNRKIEESLGYSEEEMAVMGDTFIENLVHPDDKENLYAHLLHVANSPEGETSTIEYRFRHRSGAWRWFQSHDTAFTKDEEGEVVEIIGKAIDITERKLAQTTLIESEERFRAVFEHVATGIAITDTYGNLVRCNPAYCELVGYSDEELRTVRFSEIIHPEDRNQNLLMSRKLYAGEVEHFEVENRYLRKDGEVVWVRKFVSLMKGQNGNGDKVVALVTDVTDRRRVEEELIDISRRKDEFLAMLGHELRNPLGAIRHAVQIVREADGDPASTEWAGTIIDRQSQQLSRMVDDLLDISRIKHGRIDLRLEKIDLGGVLDRAIESIRTQIALRGQIFQDSISKDGLWLEGDATRLEQVFGNLLNNAVKYTPEGGRIHLKAFRQGEEIVVSVQDTGVGIRAEILPHLFDLFRQEETTLDRSQGGLGIGLTVVKSMVDLHHGEVRIESAGVGKGSTFTVRLPGCNELQESVVTQIEGRRIQSSKKVLVVDDHEDAALGLGRLLEYRGHDVKVSHDGKIALSVADTFHPDIFLLDLGLPGLDGYQLAEALRKDLRFEKATLIAISGYAQESDKARSKAAGFDHHFAKPVNISNLFELIDRI